MKHYAIELGGLGGELCVAEVTHAFMAYWQEKDSQELADHVSNLNWGEEDELDSNSPCITPDGDNPPVWDLPMIQHASAVFADTGYSVTEMAHGDTTDPFKMGFIGDPAGHEFENIVYGHELYLDVESRDQDHVPALVSLSVEKGSFGVAVLSTPEDFDPSLLAASVVETDLGNLVDRIWYNGQELEIVMDWLSTTGQYREAQTGWLYRHAAQTDVDDLQDQLELYTR